MRPVTGTAVCRRRPTLGSSALGGSILGSAALGRPARGSRTRGSRTRGRWCRVVRDQGAVCFQACPEYCLEQGATFFDGHIGKRRHAQHLPHHLDSGHASGKQAGAQQSLLGEPCRRRLDEALHPQRTKCAARLMARQGIGEDSKFDRVIEDVLAECPREVCRLRRLLDRADGIECLDEELLLRAEAAVHVGHVHIDIARDVAKLHLFVRSPGKTRCRGVQDPLPRGLGHTPLRVSGWHDFLYAQRSIWSTVVDLDGQTTT
jgi:hypothetical protein